MPSVTVKSFYCTPDLKVEHLENVTMVESLDVASTQPLRQTVMVSNTFHN